MAGIFRSRLRGGFCLVHHFPQPLFSHGVSAGGSHLCSAEDLDGNRVVENSAQQFESAVLNIQFLLFRLIHKNAVFFDLLFPENAVQEIGSFLQFHFICLLS